MKISARNRLKDRIVDVKEGASPANVKIKVGGGIIRMRLPTKRSSSSTCKGQNRLRGHQDERFHGRARLAQVSDIMLDRRMLLTGANVVVVVLDIQNSCHEEISGTF